MQSDALYPLLTVCETIRYAAYLRIGKEHSDLEKNEIVEDIIKLLRLEKCRNTIIGDHQHRGLSGGEKRRVSIAVDVVHYPSVIFLDEPTSGLDSTTALSVVDSLKTLAKQQNCTIVMTIHQPSGRLFQLLDKVLFLSYGQVTYHGPTAALNEYTTQAYTMAGLEIPSLTGNPPELFLDLCDTLIEQNRIDLVTSQYNSDSELVEDIDINVIPLPTAPIYPNTCWEEIVLLMQRGFLNIVRTKELFLGRLGTTIFFGILLGTLFYHTDNNTSQGMNYRVAYSVITIAFYLFTSLETMPLFFHECEIFTREYSRGAYRAISYILAHCFIQLPFQCILAIIYACLTWWLIDLPQHNDLFCFHCLLIFTIITVGNAFAIFISTVVSDAMMGNTIGSACLAVMFLFSGFYIHRDDIPVYWIWLHYSSLFKFSYDSMVVNILKDHMTLEHLSNDDILKSYAVNGVNKWTGLGVLWCWIVFFRVLIYYRLVQAFGGHRK